MLSEHPTEERSWFHLPAPPWLTAQLGVFHHLDNNCTTCDLSNPLRAAAVCEGQGKTLGRYRMKALGFCFPAPVQKTAKTEAGELQP